MAKTRLVKHVRVRDAASLTLSIPVAHVEIMASPQEWFKPMPDAYVVLCG